MTRIRALLLAAGLLLIVPAAAAAAPAAAPKPVVFTIVVGKKGVAGGPKRLAVKKGRSVVIVVRSAIGGELHLHGYDIEKLVKAGGIARLAFRATLAGRFELELHARIGLRLADLTVRP